ncbi:MAG: all-trans-retinol 13,14-reductase [Thermodesulfobacteriota bacterium]|nr:all-trans-retinol 13,14-reductase [Thermodesulfobacteriota bacterium]
MSGQVLIIGSGVGGLTAGIILAQLKLPVTIVEKNPQPGGLMRSYRRAGIDCPVGVHYLGALDRGQLLRRLWDALGVTPLIPLERMGAEGIIDRYIFDNYEFNLPAGIDPFEDNLRRTFPEEQRQIKIIMADLREISRSLSAADFFLSPALSFLSPDRFESMGERLSHLGCSPRLTAVLGVPATLIGIPLWECPSYYYYMTLASYLLSAWRLAASGTTMAEAFASRFRSLGGNLVVGDGVAAIQVEAGHVKGAILSSRRILPASVVIAAIHPAVVVSLLPLGAVRPSYCERVAQLENTKGLLGVNVAVDAASHRALPYNIYRLYPDADGSITRGIFIQLRASGQGGTNLLSMITSSGSEEWRSWEKTTSGRRGRDYEAAKKALARHLISEAKKVVGPFRHMNILDIYSPLTIRDGVNSPGGSAYGIMRTTKQLMKAASLHSTAIKGLVLAGQNRLAAGIMGTMLGSYQAVRQLIGHEQFMREVVGRLL